MALGGTMRSISRISLVILLSIGSVAQALGQAPKAKRELDVPYVPTQEDVVAEMLKTGGVRKGDILYDLGCGDGRIVITRRRSSAFAAWASTSTRSASKKRAPTPKRPASRDW